MPAHLFITGSCTGVGKTLVTAGLTRALARSGRDVVPVKPVQTGLAAASIGEGDLAACLAAASLSDRFMPGDLTGCCYSTPCSPHLAASLAGERIDVGQVVEKITRLAGSHQHVLAEGAGGVMVPLTEQLTMLDLMQALGWPVLLVADNRLGAINRSLLTIAAIRGAGLTTAGIIWNNTSPVSSTGEATLREENIRIVSGLGEVSSLGECPYMDPSPLLSPAGWTALDDCFERIIETVFSNET